ncbi:MAG: hypothetical protein PWQ96_2444 [Clostridia bacterium]|nr:hypothetical protein [Clostridia bacterium]
MEWANFAKINQLEKSIRRMGDVLEAILLNQGDTVIQKVIKATEYDKKSTGWIKNDDQLIYGLAASSPFPTIETTGTNLMQEITDGRKYKLLENMDEGLTNSAVEYIHFDKNTNSYFMAVKSSDNERIPSPYFMVKIDADDFSITKKEVAVAFTSIGKIFQTDQSNLYVITRDNKLVAIRKSDLATLWEKTGLNTNMGYIATCDEQDIVLLRDAVWNSASGVIVALHKSNGEEVWSNQSTNAPYRLGDMVLTPEGKAILWGSSGSNSGSVWCEWDTTTPPYTAPATFRFENASSIAMRTADVGYRLAKDGRFAISVRDNNYIMAFQPNYENYEPGIPPSIVSGTLRQLQTGGFIPISASYSFRSIFIHEDYGKHGGFIITYDTYSNLYYNYYIQMFEVEENSLIIRKPTANSKLELDLITLSEGHNPNYVGKQIQSLRSGEVFYFENGKIIAQLYLPAGDGAERDFLVLDYEGYNNQASVYYAHDTPTQAPADLKIWAYAEAYCDLNQGEMWYSFDYNPSKRPQEKLQDEYGEKNYEPILESGQRLQLANRKFTVTISSGTNSVRINNALQQEILWVNQVYVDDVLLQSNQWSFSEDDNRTIYFEEDIEAGSKVKILYDLKFLDAYLPLYIHSRLDTADKIPPVLHELLLAYEI